MTNILSFTFMLRKMPHKNGIYVIIGNKTALILYFLTWNQIIAILFQLHPPTSIYILLIMAEKLTCLLSNSSFFSNISSQNDILLSKCLGFFSLYFHHSAAISNQRSVSHSLDVIKEWSRLHTIDLFSTIGIWSI